jgi:hypothetical protein
MWLPASPQENSKQSQGSIALSAPTVIYVPPPRSVCTRYPPKRPPDGRIEELIVPLICRPTRKSTTCNACVARSARNDEGKERKRDGKSRHQKLRGRFSRPRFLLLPLQRLVFLFLLRCFFLGCHSSILPSIVHGLCNDLLLRLIECIELMKNDVKRKMHHNIAHDESHSTSKKQIFGRRAHRASRRESFRAVL